jgi:quinol monooxygenase YgiN
MQMPSPWSLVAAWIGNATWGGIPPSIAFASAAKLVEEFTAATRAEPGNVCFDWYRGVDDPSEYVLVEAFEDAAAGEAHVGSDHFQAAMVLLPTLLAASRRS